MNNYCLAIDIGASSGRHILGSVQDGVITLEEVYRFDNRQLRKNGHDCWDLDNLWNGIVSGLKACKAAGKIPATVAIDTWAVDYVLLDGADNLLGDAVAYRDSRTQGMDSVLEEKVSPSELYARTGIQKQSFNTVYQLLAQQREYPEQLEQAESLLMIPDYFHFLLTGVKRQEYTNATSTNLVNAAAKTWDYDLIRTLGLPEGLFGPLSMPGETVGELLPEIQAEVGFNATVVLPATHDTGSAFLAVPARDDNAVYLSSGTWSLLGVENEQPITSEASRAQNFTNEGGAWYRYRYLKNIMGLWMIQSIRRELNGVNYVAGKTEHTASGKQWSFPDLIEAAKGAQDFPSVVDVDDASFLAPDSMIQAVKDYCAKTNQPVPETVGEVMQ
ncbi:MAG: rhamnulokinase, partial [Clostridiales bacterium]|nr:rhamnulokinase [Clostridiales bacterium]